MNAIDQAKAKEAERRKLEDARDRVIEAIGALLSARASRKAHSSAHLAFDLRIERSDIETLGRHAAQYAYGDDDPEKIEAAFLAVSETFEGTTVEDLAIEVAKQLNGYRGTP